jgi:uncharacterized membrane protein
MEVPHSLFANVIAANVALLVQVAGLTILCRSLVSGTLKFITCSAVTACAAFVIAVIMNIQPAFGMLLFGVWLIGSPLQLSCLAVVIVKSNCCRNRAATVVSLFATNCANGCFALEYFKAMV